MFQNLFRNLQLQHLQQHEVLFYAGEKGDKFYIVLSGSLKVCLPRAEAEIDAILSLPPEEVRFWTFADF